MHILIEMNLRLQSVEYVVFDEADRSAACLSVHFRKFIALQGLVTVGRKLYVRKKFKAFFQITL